MNLVLLCPEDFCSADRVRLRGRRLRHVLSVHRGHVGDELRVGLLNDRLGTGRIISLSDEALDMEVQLHGPPPAALPLTLLLALPRPKSLRRVLQTAAAMGVKDIILMGTWRVEKSFWQSPVLTDAALRQTLILGLEQARDTVLPQITMRRRFKPFVEDEVPDLSGGTRALLAHPTADQPCPRAVGGRVTLAVGPEGGFIPYEVEMFHARGFEIVSLGERSLRVEDAVPALLSRLF